MKSLSKKTEYNDITIGLFRQDDVFKAVAVKKSGDNFELLWHKKAPTAQTDWGQFYKQIISSAQAEQAPPLVLGYDSGNVVFYNIQVPSVKVSQIDMIVKMQAETLLPLPVEQMRLDWSLNKSDDNNNSVTIAAARKSELAEFAQSAGVLRPNQILLDCSALAKSWNTFFASDYPQPKTLLIYATADKTQICLLESGRLSRKTTLTYKIEQIFNPDTAAMFINDLRDTLDNFGYTANGAGVFILTEDKTTVENLIAVLSQYQINAQKPLPNDELLDSFEGLSSELLAEFIVPIGLCLIGFETKSESLDLFEHTYQSPRQKSGMSELSSWFRKFSIIAAVLLIVLVLVCFASDKIKLIQMEKYFSNTDPNSNIAELVEKQKLRKKIAARRPSILDLLTKINEKRDEKLLLDNIIFRKGQRVSIAGQAKDSAELAKFAESLAKQNGISEVRIQKQSFDDKQKILKFVTTFHYKNFTKKKK